MKNNIKKFKFLFLVMALVVIIGGKGILADAKNQSIKINNTTLEFNRIIYVSQSGDDFLGDGTKKKPFLTFDKAYESADDNCAIVLGEGEFKASKSAYKYIDKSKNISIIGECDKTKLIFPASPDGHYYPEGTIKFYRLAIEICSCGGDDVGGFFGDGVSPECVFVYLYNVHYIDKVTYRKFEGGDWTSTGYPNRYRLYVYNSQFDLSNYYFDVNTEWTNTCTNQPEYTLKTDASSKIKVDSSVTINNGCLTNAEYDDSYKIKNLEWQNAGEGINPDGTQANIGVYGGDFAWNDNVLTEIEDFILNIEPEQEKITLNQNVKASVVMDNIKDIAAEDMIIKYDADKLKFLGAEQVDGIKVVKDDEKDGQLRVILASQGKDNIVNDKKEILKLNFQGISVGDASVSIENGKVSDGIEMERDLSEEECGQTTITVEDYKDPNKDGQFTLLDLGIDARHYGENPADYPQYKSDVAENGAIDDDDLISIGKYMTENQNYKFSN